MSRPHCQRLTPRRRPWRGGLVEEEPRRNRGGTVQQHGRYSQSKCFFLGPMTSCVVALQTVLEMAEPVTLCCAAVIRSVMLWPDILGSERGTEENRGVVGFRSSGSQVQRVSGPAGLRSQVQRVSGRRSSGSQVAAGLSGSQVQRVSGLSEVASCRSHVVVLRHLTQGRERSRRRRRSSSEEQQEQTDRVVGTP